MPLDTSAEELNALLHTLLKSKDETFTFYFKNYEIQKSLKELLVEFNNKTLNAEHTIELNYIPETAFQVKPVTRISSSLEGHEGPVLDVAFSPDNRWLASSSGDKTVRLWEPSTEMPSSVLRAHKEWVLALSWAPDSARLSTADVTGLIIIWEVSLIKEQAEKFDSLFKKDEVGVLNAKGMRESNGFFRELRGHTNFITSMVWQPIHRKAEADRIVSSSKDGTLRLWDAVMGNCLAVGARHVKSITKVIWTGAGNIISGSQDCQIFVWDENLVFLKKLQPHSHWVNSLALNTFHALRAGFVDYEDFATFTELSVLTNAQKIEKALKSFNKALKIAGNEYLASGSDDNTVMLFTPSESDKCVRRYAGHTGPVNHIQFAPNGVLFVSASFDKTLRIWSVFQEGCLGVLRGHISEVYMLAFSRDSKWVVSGSKDSSIQIWSVKEKKRAYQLPGHADEVYAVDWSPDGAKMASAGKDMMVRIWKN